MSARDGLRIVIAWLGAGGALMMQERARRRRLTAFLVATYIMYTTWRDVPGLGASIGQPVVNRNHYYGPGFGPGFYRNARDFFRATTDGMQANQPWFQAWATALIVGMFVAFRIHP